MMTDEERATRLADLSAACSRLRELAARIREGGRPAQTESTLANISRHSQEVARQAFGYTVGDCPEFQSLGDGEVVPGVLALGVRILTGALFSKGVSAQDAHDSIHGMVDLAFRAAVLDLVIEDGLQGAQEAILGQEVAQAVREAQGLGESPTQASRASGGHSGKSPMSGQDS